MRIDQFCYLSHFAILWNFSIYKTLRNLRNRSIWKSEKGFFVSTYRFCWRWGPVHFQSSLSESLSRRPRSPCDQTLINPQKDSNDIFVNYISKEIPPKLTWDYEFLFATEICWIMASVLQSYKATFNATKDKNLWYITISVDEEKDETFPKRRIWPWWRRPCPTLWWSPIYPLTISLSMLHLFDIYLFAMYLTFF